MSIKLNEVTIKNSVKLTRIAQDKYTQGELASQIGVTRQTMNLIESQNYNPSIKVCLLIAKYLEVPVHQLFWIEE